MNNLTTSNSVLSIAELSELDKKYRKTLHRLSIVSLDQYAEYEPEDMDWAGPLGLAMELNVNAMVEQANRCRIQFDLNFIDAMNLRGHNDHRYYASIDGQMGARDEQVIRKTAE